MRIISAAVPLAALLLAACGSEPDQPKTADEVIAASKGLTKPNPGKYVSRARMIEFSVPGLPKEQADQLKAMMSGAGSEESTYCLTPAEAEKGFEDAVRKMGEGSNGMKCTFDRFDTAGGKLDAALTCSGPGGMNAQMAMDGEMAAETSRLHMDMTQKAPGIPGGEMKMEMEVTAKRVGECA